MTTILAPTSYVPASTPEAQFRALLLSHAPLAAAVGSRVALNAVPDGATLPLIVFVAKHNRQFGLNNDLLSHFVLFEVQCWAATAAAAAELAQMVWDAIQLAPASVGAVVVEQSTTFEDELGLDGVQLVVDWWVT